MMYVCITFVALHYMHYIHDVCHALQPQWISTNVDLQEEEYGANEEIINLDRDILKSISGKENDLGLR